MWKGTVCFWTLHRIVISGAMCRLFAYSGEIFTFLEEKVKHEIATVIILPGRLSTKNKSWDKILTKHGLVQ